MNRIIKFLAALALCLMPAAADAEWYNNITFVVGSGARSPITVRYNGQSYTVYNSKTINTTGNTYTPSATDATGNSMKYEVSSRTETNGSDKYHTFTYTFYSRSNGSSSGNSGGGYYGGYNSGSNDSYDSPRNTGEAIGGFIFGLGGGAEGDAYPSLQIAPGISYGRGENVRIRYTGRGFHAYASIGKDFLFGSEYKDKILWNAGLGSYFAFGGNGNPNMDISLGLSVGQMAQWEKLCFMIDVDYTYWIGRWRRVGIYAGGSIGWSNFTKWFDKNDYSTKVGFAWNIEAGFVIRIANF